MSDKLYQVAIILTIRAPNYQEALQTTIDFNGQLGNTDPSFDNIDITNRVVLDYERDNDNQRVVYLDDEANAEEA